MEQQKKTSLDWNKEELEALQLVYEFASLGYISIPLHDAKIVDRVTRDKFFKAIDVLTSRIQYLTELIEKGGKED